MLNLAKGKFRFTGQMLAISLAAGMLNGAAGALAQQTAGPADFTAIVREKTTAVVAITTRQRVQQQEPSQILPEELPFREFFRRRFDPTLNPDQQQPRQTLGSGFFVSADGYIVTTSHVVENAEEIQIVLASRNVLPARLVGRDPSTDVAVLKVDPPSGIAILAWGDSDTAEPGSWTIAMANPFGLGGAVTVGVVSSRAGDVPSGPTDDYIQTDAATSRDYSGGPLLNTRGEVIGINTAVLSSTGASIGSGFAIPSRTAQAVADQLIRSGRVERGYIGLRLQDMTPVIAQALGLSETKGVLAASVEPNNPAERAGIKAGDVITSFNGRPVASGRELSRIVATLAPGTQVPVTVLRENKPQDLKVVVGSRSEDQPTQAVAPQQPDGGRRLGLALSPIPETAKDQLGLDPGTSGVLIDRVDPDSPAAANGLQPGDVIVSANNQPINLPSDVANAWGEAQKQKKPMLLRVKRRDQYLFIGIMV